MATMQREPCNKGQIATYSRRERNLNAGPGDVVAISREIKYNRPRQPGNMTFHCRAFESLDMIDLRGWTLAVLPLYSRVLELTSQPGSA